MSAVLKEFDPAIVKPEDVVGLTGPQCRLVLAHYEIPLPPKSWKVSDVRAMTEATVLGKLTEVEATAVVEEPAVVPDPEPAHDAPGTDIEQHRPNSVVVIPEASKWQQITAMAEYIFRSNLKPVALKSPEDVGIVLLAANDLGIPLTQAVDKIFVVHGRKGMMAELMLAVIRRDGHNIVPDPDNDGTFATAHCRRKDNGDAASVTFTLEEAMTAGLVAMKDGKPYKRDKNGKAEPWEVYTADMLWARCVARAARRMFSDCLAGVSYIPDELGYIDADDEPAPRQGRHGEATITVGQQRSAIAARIQELPEDLRREVGAEWTSRGFPRLLNSAGKPGKANIDALTPAGISQMARFLDGLEERAQSRVDADPEVEEAVVVDPDERCAQLLDGGVQCRLVAGHTGPHETPDDDDDVAEAELVEQETIEQMRDRLLAEKASGSDAVGPSGESTGVVAPEGGQIGTGDPVGSSSGDSENPELAGRVCVVCEGPAQVLAADGTAYCVAHETF